MIRIKFAKMVAAGNDFVVVDSLTRLSIVSIKELARKMCERKFGVGADGLLVLGKSKVANVKMRIFNSDGSEADMCGNGARCAAFYIGKKNVFIETKAGVIRSRVTSHEVKIKLTDPKDVKFDIPLRINNRCLRVNFVDTGVPHAVIFVQGLEDIDVKGLGSAIRYHPKFAPGGANVNFVEVSDSNTIKVRTYERGVEGETLACGTGSVASALITACRLKDASHGNIIVHTKGGELLKVYYTKRDISFTGVWLQGNAEVTFQGEFLFNQGRQK